jgi:Fungal specific transcription factor domain
MQTCIYFEPPSKKRTNRRTPSSTDGTEDHGEGPSGTNVNRSSKISLPSALEPDSSFNSPIWPRDNISPDTHMQDLELMHYYATRTSLSLSADLQTTQLLQEEMCREAFANDFLMHGLLALTAVHIIYQTKDYDGWWRAARSHNDEALSSFIRALNNINPVNCHALFAFSWILAILAISSARAAATGIHVSAVEKTVGFFLLLRGVRTVIRYEWVVDGPLGSLIDKGEPRPTGYLSYEIRVALAQLLDKYYRSTDDDQAIRASYTLAVAQLQAIFDCVGGSVQDSNYILAWPDACEGSFLTFLQEGRPMAFAVLAYYGALLHRLNDLWWAYGWGSQLVEAINVQIDLEWRPLIQQAVLEVRGDVMGMGMLAGTLAGSLNLAAGFDPGLPDLI